MKEEEDFEELDNDNEEFDQEMGAGIDPVEEARKPKQRRGKFLALAGFGVIVALILVVAMKGRGSKDANPAVAADTLNQGKAIALAAPVDSGNNQAVSLQVDTTKQAADTSQRLIDEKALTPYVAAQGNNNGNSGNNGSTGGFPSAGTAIGNLSDLSLPTGNSNTQANQGYAETGGQVLTTGPSAREQQMAREAARREAEATRAAAYAVWLAGEQSRLRRPTQISLGGSETAGEAGSNVGTSRFGNETPSGDGVADTPDTDNEAGTGDSNDNFEAGSSQVINGVTIPPGARVRAITMTEYRSDLEGDQTLQIQLQEPLRVNSRTVLPAGTIGYGKVSSTAGGAGRSAYVQMTVTTFQTKQGQVIRGVRAQAGDPETYAMAIKGKTDNRLGERIARGLAATVLDIGFASASQKLAYKISGQEQSGSNFDLTPSPTDVALLRSQERAQPIISAAVGDENSVQPAVVLKRGTPFVLFFGF